MKRLLKSLFSNKEHKPVENIFINENLQITYSRLDHTGLVQRYHQSGQNSWTIYNNPFYPVDVCEILDRFLNDEGNIVDCSDKFIIIITKDCIYKATKLIHKEGYFLNPYSKEVIRSRCTYLKQVHCLASKWYKEW